MRRPRGRRIGLGLGLVTAYGICHDVTMYEKNMRPRDVPYTVHNLHPHASPSPFICSRKTRHTLQQNIDGRTNQTHNKAHQCTNMQWPANM